MASKVLFMLSLVVLLVTTCHARPLLKGFALSNGNNNVLIATASAPVLNLALPTQFFKAAREQPSSLPSGGNAGGGTNLDVEDNNNRIKYNNMKLRSLVLAALPRGTKANSGPSKRHNEFNT
uniref:Uncharacterized protein n=1 Tax=Chenopodium quinoa TaxID=63459 RepID=A0A803L3C7_CHEQI